MLHDFSLLGDEHLVFLAVIVAIVAATLAWIVTALSVQCRRWRQTRQMLAFKRDMVERGLSIEQIERLLAAASPTRLSLILTGLAQAALMLLTGLGGLLRRAITACQWGGVVRQRQELEFKARLVERGLSVAEIERLYEAQLPSWPARLAAAIQAALVQACTACRKFGQSLRPVTTH